MYLLGHDKQLWHYVCPLDVLKRAQPRATDLQHYFQMCAITVLSHVNMPYVTKHQFTVNRALLLRICVFESMQALTSHPVRDSIWHTLCLIEQIYMLRLRSVPVCECGICSCACWTGALWDLLISWTAINGQWFRSEV